MSGEDAVSTTWVRILLVFAAAAAAVAAEHEQPRVEAHEAHVHGVGWLNLALEGSELYLEFGSPAANLLGFEHAPGDAHERAAVQRIRALLSAPGDLFGLPPGAGCRAVDADLEIPWSDGQAADSGGQRPAGHERDGVQSGGVHADIHAAYRFRCAAPVAVDAVEVLLFEVFPALRRLDVQFITSDRQAAVVLSPDRHLLRL